MELADIDLASVTPGVWTTHAGEADIETAGYYLVSFVFNTPDSPENAKDIVIDQAYIVGSATGGGTPISALPEPSTWLLMFAGFGGFGMLLRQSKRNAALRDKDAFAL